MLVTLDGITTEVKPEQPENAYDPMLVTLEGFETETEVKPEQPRNADSPMLVTLEGIEELLHPYTKVFVAVSMMALHPSRLSYVAFASSTTMVVRLACRKLSIA